MTDPTYTDITMVLDRSGSMQSIKNDTIGGFDAFISEQRRLPGRCTVSLVQFDNEYEEVYTGRADRRGAQPDPGAARLHGDARRDRPGGQRHRRPVGGAAGGPVAPAP